MEEALRSRNVRFGALFVLLGAVCVYVGMWAKQECFFPANDFYCYREAAARILTEDGVAPALSYVGERVSPRTGYAFAHLILHDIGEYAYGMSGDLDEALAQLERYRTSAPPDKDLLPFDGFVHGVVSSYFLASGDPHTYPRLMQEICQSSRSMPGVTRSEASCHHALGHGLVHASANRIAPALTACVTAGTTTAREGCYYGAFMELSFLYLPGYHPGAPRPDSKDASLKELCVNLSEDARPHCMHFVGQSYLHAHPKDFDGAFAECAGLGEFDEICAKRLGQVMVTNYVRDEHEAQVFCKRYAGLLEDVCFDAAREAIDLGFGRESNSFF